MPCGRCSCRPGAGRCRYDTNDDLTDFDTSDQRRASRGGSAAPDRHRHLPAQRRRGLDQDVGGRSGDAAARRSPATTTCSTRRSCCTAGAAAGAGRGRQRRGRLPRGHRMRSRPRSTCSGLRRRGVAGRSTAADPHGAAHRRGRAAPSGCRVRAGGDLEGNYSGPRHHPLRTAALDRARRPDDRLRHQLATCSSTTCPTASRGAISAAID